MPAITSIPDELKQAITQEIQKAIETKIKSYQSYQQLNAAFSNSSSHHELIKKIEGICKQYIDQSIKKSLEVFFLTQIVQQNKEDLLFMQLCKKSDAASEDGLKEALSCYDKEWDMLQDEKDKLTRRILDAEASSMVAAIKYYNNYAAADELRRQNSIDIQQYKKQLSVLESKMATNRSKREEVKKHQLNYIRIKNRIKNAEQNELRYKGAIFYEGLLPNDLVSSYSEIPLDLSQYLSSENIDVFRKKKKELEQLSVDGIKELNAYFEKRYVDMTAEILTSHIQQVFPGSNFPALISAMKTSSQQTILDRRTTSLTDKLSSLKAQQAQMQTELDKIKEEYQKLPTIEQQRKECRMQEESYHSWSTKFFTGAFIFALVAIILITLGLSVNILTVGLAGLAALPIAYGLYKISDYLYDKKNDYCKREKTLASEENKLRNSYYNSFDIEHNLKANRQEQQKIEKEIEQIHSGLSEDEENVALDEHDTKATENTTATFSMR